VALRNREQRQLFPTLLTSFDVDFAHVATLKAEIFERERTTPTTPRGERTSWQSDDRLLQWSSVGRAFGQMILEAVDKAFPAAEVREVMLAAWANVIRKGDQFNPHSHPDAAWSGVYYLDAAEAGGEQGGWLYLRDPRAGAGATVTSVNRFDCASTFEIQPRTGLLLLFPGWLLHWVTAYRGENPRISVAFNVR